MAPKMTSDDPKLLKIKAQQTWVWRIALALTAIILGFAVYTLWGNVCPYDWCTSSLNRFLSSNPNEIGDTLAGFFGAGAFVWVVAAVILQSIELSMQREEFKKMVDEQKDQAKALNEQVKAMNIQVEFFKEESKARKQDAARKELDQLYVRMANQLKKNNNILGWNFTHVDYVNDIPSLKGITLKSGRLGEVRLWFNAGAELSEAPCMFRIAKEQLAARSPRLDRVQKKYDRLAFEPLKECCDEIEALKPSLAKADKDRMINDNLDGLLAQLMILYNADVWIDE